MALGSRAGTGDRGTREDVVAACLGQELSRGGDALGSGALLGGSGAGAFWAPAIATDRACA